MSQKEDDEEEGEEHDVHMAGRAKLARRMKVLLSVLLSRSSTILSFRGMELLLCQERKEIGEHDGVKAMAL